MPASASTNSEACVTVIIAAKRDSQPKRPECLALSGLENSFEKPRFLGF